MREPDIELEPIASMLEREIKGRDRIFREFDASPRPAMT